MVFQDTIHPYYMDGYLKMQLDKMKDKVMDDWDFVIVIDGYERSGKSTLAQQIATYLDLTFNLEHIVFNGVEFEKVTKGYPANTAIIFDEGFGDLTSRKWMNKLNHSIIKMLTEIGYKNLFLIIVLPTYYDLVKYIAIHRSRVLIHVYDNNFERGYFAWYDREKKKDLFVQGKKFYSYSQRIARPNFIGRFTKHMTVDIEAYKEKKRQNAIASDRGDSQKADNIDRPQLIKRMKVLGYNQTQIAEILDLTKQRISQLMKVEGIFI